MPRHGRYDRDGFRPGDVSGVKFEYWLQGGLDDCCSLYAVMNAFSYFYGRDEKRSWDWRWYWDKLGSHRLVREHIANVYKGGAYPRDVEELAGFVNDEIFGKRYQIDRIDDHGSFKNTKKALEALTGQKALYLVLVEEDKDDKLGHWIVLIKTKSNPSSERNVIDSNRGYFCWKLDQALKLVIRRENEPDDISISKVESVISID